MCANHAWTRKIITTRCCCARHSPPSMAGRCVSLLLLLLPTSAKPPPQAAGAGAGRWPSCAAVSKQQGTIEQREAVMRHGLELGLARLWQQLEEPPARNISGAGNEANVLSMLGGALAEMDLYGNITAAEHLVRLAFANQSTDGLLPWIPMDLHNTNWDGHGVLLSFLQLVPLLYRHGHRFSPDFDAFLRPRLALGLRASWTQGSAGLWYTNILIGKITNNILIGGWLNDSQSVAEGEQLLDQWLNFRLDNSDVFVHEYESTFYFWNDFNALLPAAQYSRGSRAAARLLAATDQLFAHLAANYFAPTRTMVAPHSRDYNFLTGKFYIIRGVWGSGVMGMTLAFLDPDMSAVTAPTLSDLENAVLYHALTTDDGYRPPCELIELAASGEVREVRSKQGLLSNITGDRTVVLLPEMGYAVGSVSEDFAAVPNAWSAQSKEVNIEVAPPSTWNLAASDWPSVSTVVDDHDAPWGLVRRVQNWTKPQHLRGRLGSAQFLATQTNVTFLLVTLDIDAAQITPPDASAQEDRQGEKYTQTSPPLQCNASSARHGVGWAGNYKLLQQLILPPSAKASAAMEHCAALCCSNARCTGWAVKPANTSRECVLVKDGVQTFPNPEEYSGASGRPINPGPTPTPSAARSSLATNVIFPARAEHIFFGRRDVVFPDSTGPAGYVLRGEQAAAPTENASVMLVQGGVCVAARVIRADPVHAAGDQVAPAIELKADTASLQHNAARLAIYHYRGKERMLQGSVKLALGLVTGPCAAAGGPSGFLDKVLTMTATSTVGTDGRWINVLKWDSGQLGGDTAGSIAVEREDGPSAKVLSRKVNGAPVCMPASELTVNGKPVSFLGAI